MKLGETNCLNCGKKFTKKAIKHYYCSRDCYKIANDHKIEPIFINCLWCHQKIRAMYKHQHFCNGDDDRCKYSYRCIFNRVKSLFFGLNSEDREIEKLERLGCNYRFPRRFNQLNYYYGLIKHDEKAMSELQP